MYKVTNDQLLTSTTPIKTYSAETEHYIVSVVYYGDYKKDYENKTLNPRDFHAVATDISNYFPSFQTNRQDKIEWVTITTSPSTLFSINPISERFEKDLAQMKKEVTEIEYEISLLMPENRCV